MSPILPVYGVTYLPGCSPCQGKCRQPIMNAATKTPNMPTASTTMERSTKLWAMPMVSCSAVTSTVSATTMPAASRSRRHQRSVAGSRGRSGSWRRARYCLKLAHAIAAPIAASSSLGTGKAVDWASSTVHNAPLKSTTLGREAPALGPRCSGASGVILWTAAPPNEMRFSCRAAAAADRSFQRRLPPCQLQARVRWHQER